MLSALISAGKNVVAICNKCSYVAALYVLHSSVGFECITAIVLGGTLLSSDNQSSNKSNSLDHDDIFLYQLLVLHFISQINSHRIPLNCYPRNYYFMYCSSLIAM